MDEILEIEYIIAINAAPEGGLYFKVHWKGYDSSEDSWEPEENLLDCKDAMYYFFKDVPEALKIYNDFYKSEAVKEGKPIPKRRTLNSFKPKRTPEIRKKINKLEELSENDGSEIEKNENHSEEAVVKEKDKNLYEYEETEEYTSESDSYNKEIDENIKKKLEKEIVPQNSDEEPISNYIEPDITEDDKEQRFKSDSECSDSDYNENFVVYSNENSLFEVPILNNLSGYRPKTVDKNVQRQTIPAQKTQRNTAKILSVDEIDPIFGKDLPLVDKYVVTLLEPGVEEEKVYSMGVAKYLHPNEIIDFLFDEVTKN